MYRTRNAAYRKVPWVRIPPSPPFGQESTSWGIWPHGSWFVAGKTELVKKYLIKYSVHFHYYSFGGEKKSDVRSGEYEMEGPSLEEASRLFKDYFYAKMESYFVAFPEFGWKLTHLEIDKIWESPANLETVFNGILAYYENLIKRIGEGPLGSMDNNRI